MDFASREVNKVRRQEDEFKYRPENHQSSIFPWLNFSKGIPFLSQIMSVLFFSYWLWFPIYSILYLFMGEKNWVQKPAFRKSILCKYFSLSQALDVSNREKKKERQVHKTGEQDEIQKWRTRFRHFQPLKSESESESESNMKNISNTWRHRRTGTQVILANIEKLRLYYLPVQVVYLIRIISPKHWTSEIPQIIC